MVDVGICCPGLRSISEFLFGVHTANALLPPHSSRMLSSPVEPIRARQRLISHTGIISDRLNLLLHMTCVKRIASPEWIVGLGPCLRADKPPHSPLILPVSALMIAT